MHTPVPYNEDKRLAFLHSLRLENGSHFDEIQGLCEVAAQIAGVPITLVTLVDATQQSFVASIGVGDIKGTDREIAFCAHAIMASQQFEVVDARLDPRFAENPLVVGEPGIQSYLGTVLEPEPEMRLGTLCLLDTKPRTHSAEVKTSLSKLGQAISALLIAHRQKMNLLDFSDQVLQNNIEMASITTSLQQSLKQIVVAESAKSQFLANITHELRTPLTSIKGALNLLSSNLMANDPARLRRLISIADQSSERLISLVDDILMLQKINSDDPVGPLLPVDLAALLTASVAANKGFAATRSLMLTVSGLDQPCFVDGDKKLLEKVVTNILSNAFKYSKRGGHVEIELCSLEAGLQLTVKDDGVGIPEGAEGKVFGMFTQVDGSDTRSHPGAGVGMYICQKILQLHNATIGYTSKLGIGTTFCVRFPKVSAQERLCG
jgi:signal transduction histidine kinase